MFDYAYTKQELSMVYREFEVGQVLEDGEEETELITYVDHKVPQADFLDSIAKSFARMLKIMGYDYVERVSIRTENGEIVSNGFESWTVDADRVQDAEEQSDDSLKTPRSTSGEFGPITAEELEGTR